MSSNTGHNRFSLCRIVFVVCTIFAVIAISSYTGFYPSKARLTAKAETESSAEPEKGIQTDLEKTNEVQIEQILERQIKKKKAQKSFHPEQTEKRQKTAVSIKSLKPDLKDAVNAIKKADKLARQMAHAEKMKRDHEAADAQIKQEKEEQEAAQKAAEEAAQQAAAAEAQQQSSAPAPSSVWMDRTVYQGTLYVGSYSADVYSLVNDVYSETPLAQQICDNDYSAFYSISYSFFGDHNFQGFTQIIYNDTATMVWADGTTQTMTKIWQGVGTNVDTLRYSDGSLVLENRYGTYLMYTCTGNGGDEVYLTFWN